MESFSEKANRAKVLAGKGAPLFKTINTPKPMNFVDAVPAEIAQIQTEGTGKSTGSRGKPWSERR